MDSRNLLELSSNKFRRVSNKFHQIPVVSLSDFHPIPRVFTPKSHWNPTIYTGTRANFRIPLKSSSGILGIYSCFLGFRNKSHCWTQGELWIPLKCCQCIPINFCKLQQNPNRPQQIPNEFQQASNISLGSQENICIPPPKCCGLNGLREMTPGISFPNGDIVGPNTMKEEPKQKKKMAVVILSQGMVPPHGGGGLGSAAAIIIYFDSL